MSASSPVGTLIINGYPGSEIRVLDQDFNLKGRGTVLLRVDLVPGLYIVNWKTAEVTQKEIVRVHEGRERIVYAPALPAAPLTELPPEQEATLSDALRPSEIHRGADVVVLLDGRGVSAPRDLGIRLYAADASGTAMRSDRQAVRNAQTASGDLLARVYHVSPGLYRLQYRGTTGDTLTQSVPAMAGRQTVFLLRLAEAHVLVSNEEALETHTHVGIEPGLSTMVSIAAGEPVKAHLEATRTASILLNDLSNNRSSLGEDLMRLIEGDKCDPLLKLYAAAVIVNRLDLDASPTLDASYPTSGSDRRAFRAQWLRRADALLSRRRRKGVPVDYVVLRRRCAEELKGSEKLPILESPPLLQVSWRLAIKGSFSNPRAIPESFSFRGAEQGAVSAPPWLVWRPAAAKAGAATTGKMPGLNETLGRLAESTSTLISMTEQSSRSQDPLAFLSSESSSLANAAFQVAGQGTRPKDFSRQLAETVQVSARTLRSAAGQALADVNRAIETYQSRQSLESMTRSTSRSAPPPLRRPVIDPDDPHHARFGGQPEAGGARLSATFKPIKGRADQVEVVVKATVETSIENEVAEFFLHDTFEPNHLVVPLHGKVARVQFATYGGFTVGAWLPSRSTELELDLQQVAKAPSIVRNR